MTVEDNFCTSAVSQKQDTRGHLVTDEDLVLPPETQAHQRYIQCNIHHLDIGTKGMTLLEEVSWYPIADSGYTNCSIAGFWEASLPVMMSSEDVDVVATFL